MPCNPKNKTHSLQLAVRAVKIRFGRGVSLRIRHDPVSNKTLRRYIRNCKAAGVYGEFISQITELGLKLSPPFLIVRPYRRSRARKKSYIVPEFMLILPLGLCGCPSTLDLFGNNTGNLNGKTRSFASLGRTINRHQEDGR